MKWVTFLSGAAMKNYSLAINDLQAGASSADDLHPCCHWHDPTGSGSDNMVFTQGRGFVLGASLSLQIRSLRCRFPVCDTADTASLATCFLFDKLFCVAITSGFGEKRCRKNLPLSDTDARIRLVEIRSDA